eukprot:scaffold2908_cov62-Phaeocystis_antarctica.AAC.7
MSASFVEALGTLASPRTAAAHSSRSLVTLSSQLLDESVSSEATLPSVEAGQSRVSTSVRLGSSQAAWPQHLQTSRARLRPTPARLRERGSHDAGAESVPG